MRPIDADREIRELEKIIVGGETFTIAVEFAKLILRNAPTVEAEPVRHGKWIRDELGERCDICSLYAYRDMFGQPWESPYCPNCGAKMDKGRKEE